MYDNPNPQPRAVGAYDNDRTSPNAVLPQNALFDDIIYDNRENGGGGGGAGGAEGTTDENGGSGAAGALGADVRERNTTRPSMTNAPSLYDVPKPLSDSPPPPLTPPPPPPVAQRPSKQNGHHAPPPSSSNSQTTDVFNMCRFHVFLFHFFIFNKWVKLYIELWN